MIFLDANIFIRYITGDDPRKAADCLTLFRQIDKGVDAMTSEIVIAEVVYVLSSSRQYGMAHVDVKDRLRPLIEHRGIHVDEKRRILRALDIYAVHPHLDFEDCLTAALIEQQDIDVLMSYDSGFDRLPGIRRMEPPIDPA